MKNKRMTFRELRDLFLEHNKTQLSKTVKAFIVFDEGSWPGCHYSLESRTYKIASNNKAFRTNCCSSSLFGSCIDGSDRNVRLDWYMEDFGNKNGWVVDYCYLEDGDDYESHV